MVLDGSIVLNFQEVLMGGNSGGCFEREHIHSSGGGRSDRSREVHFSSSADVGGLAQSTP